MKSKLLLLLTPLLWMCDEPEVTPSLPDNTYHLEIFSDGDLVYETDGRVSWYGGESAAMDNFEDGLVDQTSVVFLGFHSANNPMFNAFESGYLYEGYYSARFVYKAAGGILRFTNIKPCSRQGSVVMRMTAVPDEHGIALMNESWGSDITVKATFNMVNDYNRDPVCNGK